MLFTRRMQSFTPSHNPENEVGFYLIILDSYMTPAMQICVYIHITLLLYYIFYYSRYYYIYAILDSYMTPAMQISCGCVCVYIYIHIYIYFIHTHTHNLPIHAKYHHVLSSSCYLEILRIFTHYNFSWKTCPAA